MSLSFLLASSTAFGVQAAESLLAANFICAGAVTPAPRPKGRKQIFTPTPVHEWAQERHYPAFLLTDKISPDLKTTLPSADFLLVIDFGYYVPGWLIKLPRLLAVNLHPSALPQYRGASPGQAVIKNGDSLSAMSIMTLAAQMDAGDLLAQIPFAVGPHWTAGDYYQHAFTLVTEGKPSILATTLTDFAAGKIKLQAQTGEPSFAPKITKADTFIPWSRVQAALTGSKNLAPQIERQIRAFSPRPLVWTKVATGKGEKRLQLLSAHLEQNCLVLDQVKLEGDTAKPFSTLMSRLVKS